jgi:hypothetical protein
LNVEKVREGFPFTRDVVYMNVANHDPPSLPTQNAVLEYLGKIFSEGGGEGNA